MAVIPGKTVAALPGKGVVGTIDGRDIWAASPGYLQERLGDASDEALAAHLDRTAVAGLTGIIVGEANSVVGLITLGDTARPEARQIVAQLHALGIAQVAILTGDARGHAHAIARETRSEEHTSELQPEIGRAHV